MQPAHQLPRLTGAQHTTWHQLSSPNHLPVLPRNSPGVASRSTTVRSVSSLLHTCTRAPLPPGPMPACSTPSSGTSGAGGCAAVLAACCSSAARPPMPGRKGMGCCCGCCRACCDQGPGVADDSDSACPTCRRGRRWAQARTKLHGLCAAGMGWHGLGKQAGTGVHCPCVQHHHGLPSLLLSMVKPCSGDEKDCLHYRCACLTAHPVPQKHIAQPSRHPPSHLPTAAGCRRCPYTAV